MLYLRGTNTHLCLIFFIRKKARKISRSNEDIIRALTLCSPMAQCATSNSPRRTGLLHSSSALLTILSFKHVNQSYIKAIPLLS